ncbi:MAG: hypothetical protein F9K43_09500 [Bauldia sp.]|nr:MAG: hypothetical protein F9K43_09500 [Bauldia sp.]MBE0693287.1 hypothetical protein [Aquamicrobium sp.]
MEAAASIVQPGRQPAMRPLSGRADIVIAATAEGSARAMDVDIVASPVQGDLIAPEDAGFSRACGVTPFQLEAAEEKFLTVLPGDAAGNGRMEFAGSGDIWISLRVAPPARPA